MHMRTYLSLAILAALPAWSQVAPSASGGYNPKDDDLRMRIPPAVSDEAYPIQTLAEVRSNYLSANIALDSSYDDNVQPGVTKKPVGDMAYSFTTALEFSQVTPRLRQTWTYRPGFTVYQRASGLNAGDQGGGLKFNYRMSPYVALDVADSFEKSSNVFNQAYGGVPGPGQQTLVGAILPIGNRFTNYASGQVNCQFSRSAAFGAGGTSSILEYANSLQAGGLSTSNLSEGASVFYNLRISKSQYSGVRYQYATTQATSKAGGSNTQTHTIHLFYTIYLADTLSLSLSLGPQHFDAKQPPFPRSGSWTPAVSGSVGWQRQHMNLAASYSRTVNAGGGLVGTYYSNSASANARWQLSRVWTADSEGNYENHKNVSPLDGRSSPGGLSVSGGATVQRAIGQRFTLRIGYQRLHERYNEVAAIKGSPDSNRESFTISYQLTRPLGR